MKIAILNYQNEEPALYGELQEKLESKYPGVFDIKAYDCVELDASPRLLEECLGELVDADGAFLTTHGGLGYFRGFLKASGLFLDKKPICIRSGIEGEARELLSRSGLTLRQYDALDKYLGYGGAENYFNAVLYFSNEFAGTDYPVEEPKKTSLQCLYTPKGPVKKEDEEKLLLETKACGKPVVGILIHENRLIDGDMGVADALYAAVERHGGRPLVVVTSYQGPDTAEGLRLDRLMEKYLTPYADAIINTLGMSSTVMAFPGDGAVVERETVFGAPDLPVVQAMQTYYTYEGWLKSNAGLEPMMLACNVYEPELDGQLITFPVCSRENEETEYGVRHRAAPISERADKAARLALNWARLRRIPNEDKKIAIIFHNMPPRNDSIGCAFGLDTPASVFNMLVELKKAGVRLDYDFADGDEIINKIIEGLSNDSRWLPKEEMLRRSADTVGRDLYQKWFDGLGEKARRELRRDWGEPPGDFMAAEEKILVPGIINGNVFIGLQPARAFEEQAEKCYHSTDLVCPHQYIAYYRWIENVFGANAVVHVGTHGTLEWLPGKEIGLSGDCYPDIAIGALPNIYPYNIGVTGEGMQAKRRSYAALIGHMIPSMTDGGTYGELAELEEKIDEWYDARLGDRGKLPTLFDEIWELAVRQNLTTDLNVAEKPEGREQLTFTENLHLWISRIKFSSVRDGLHIMGRIPEPEQFKNMCRLLVRVANNDVPSIRQGVAALHGLDADRLMDEPAALRDDGRTNAMLLSELDREGGEIFDRLMEADYDPAGIPELLKACGDGGNTEKLEKCLRFVCDKVAPSLKLVTDELRFFSKGIAGEFIMPGPSGNPSRGNAEILPTGRNFYSSDPCAIPSRAAWRTGGILAAQLLARELRDNGRHPESVAIIIYAGETMKTKGDDVAEALALLGVRPVWLGNTERVAGLEIIPLEELGRPRIDVTLRISGLFRDTFPNLIERIEDAVNMVAALDEPAEANYLRKHVDEEVAELLAQGNDREQAYDRATARIFGCPPGGYGAGVDTLINSKKWSGSDDLGRIYLRWSGHVYGKKHKGEEWRDVLALRLSKTAVTVKNESSVEIDMLDSDDYYNYHGGLIAAVKASGGKKPSSYSANTADANHVETLSVAEETARIMRARIGNPKWLEGLKRHGYKGAQEISAMVDIIFGWDATSDNIEDWMYEDITRKFVLDRETRDWIMRVNKWAMHAMTERLLEAESRGMWDAPEAMLAELKELYLETEGGIEECL